MAIPLSDQPGYEQSHQRIIAAVERGREWQNVDFKQSETWRNLQWKLIKTSMAMANLRDGGLIIIGVKEDNNNFLVTGITPEHLATFDSDVIHDAFAVYSDPGISVEIFRTSYQRIEVLSFRIEGLKATPIICKKNGPQGSDIVEATFYIRPAAGRPRTTKVTKVAEMRDVLDIAAEHKAREMVQVFQVLEKVPPRVDANALFNGELEGL